MAQRRSQNRTQNEDESEYVEMDLPPVILDTNMDIHVTPSDLNLQNAPRSDVVMEQETAGGIYDMPGTSDVYNIQGRGMSRQAQPVKKSEKSGGWTMVKKFQITIALMILVISTSAFSITWFSMLTGNVHSMIHRVQE